MFRRLASLGISVCYAFWANLRRQEQNRCVILYYHGVAREQVDRFYRQMEWLQSREEIIRLRELLIGEWSGQTVCLTFDDALDNVRQNALPILREFKIPATIFAVPGNLGREPSWAIADNHPDRHVVLSSAEQLREYPPDLIDIGSHTMTHRDLAMLSGDALFRELSESKQALEKLLGRTVSMLSVPYGSYNEETLRAARETGYKLVVTCDPEVMHPGNSKLRVGRFKVAPDDWDMEFWLKSAGAHRWRRAWQRLKGHSPSGNGVNLRKPESVVLAERSS